MMAVFLLSWWFAEGQDESDAVETAVGLNEDQRSLVKKIRAALKF